MIKGKIAVNKIDKSALFTGQNSTYLDVVLIESPNNQYGDDYMIVQDLPRERRDAGEKGAILGNARIIKKAESAPSQPAPTGGGSATKEDWF